MLQKSHPDYNHKECGGDDTISLAQTFSQKDDEK